ncbi:TPA: helix-turn-helix domain-containing protein [Serratia marcescens]
MTNESISSRLKKERKRLKLTQASAAALAGVRQETWSRYESGSMSPGMEVLAALALTGANVQYILTGEEKGGAILTQDEKEMLMHYRAAPLAVRMAALAALTSAHAPKMGISVTGSNNRVAGGDYHERKK